GDGLEEVHMLHGPVADEVGAAEGIGELARHRRSLVLVIHFHPYATHAVVHTVERLSVLQVDQGVAPVVFVHASVEDAYDGEAAEARDEAGGRDVALGDHQDHLVAGRHSQGVGQILAQHDAVTTGREVLDAADRHALAHLRHCPFQVRFDAAYG